MNQLFKNVNTFSGNILQHSIKNKFNSKLFFLILLFSLISKVQKGQAYCNPTFSGLPTEIALCDNPYDMSGLVTPLPVGTGGSTFSGSGVSGTYFYPNIAGVGIHTITYNHGMPCSISTSDPTQTIEVVNTSNLVILANNTSMSKITLSGTFVCSLTVAHASLYHNFQWWKNGFILPGETNSYYNTNDMGTYMVEAEGYCSGGTHDEIEVACDCGAGLGATSIGTTGSVSNLTSRTGAGGGAGYSNTHFDFVFKGTLLVPEGTTVTLSTANIRMEACSQIIVKKSVHNGVAGGKLIIDNCTITGCDKWQGIIVEGNGNVNTDPKLGWVQATGHNGVEISDAFKAFYATNGGKLELDGGSAGGIKFENNENDITMMGYTNDYSPTLQYLDFKGKWLHNDYSSICGGAPSGYTNPNASASSNKKMIYLEGVKEFNINNCAFTGNRFFNGGSDFIINAVEMYSDNNVNMDNVSFGGVLSSGIYGNLLSNTVPGSPVVGYSFHSNYLFNNYTFNGIFDKAIYFTGSSNITLGYFTPSWSSSNQNSFLGGFNYGTYLTYCDHTYQYGNIFNTATFSSPADAGGTFANLGVYYEYGVNSTLKNCVFKNVSYPSELFQTYPAKIEDNNFLSSDYGMQVYAQNSDATYHIINIENNRFVNNNIGLIISPEGNPVGAQSNYTPNYMQTKIKCNYFKNNNYAIMGCGNLIDQGTYLLSNGNKWDNNYYWDWLWDASYNIYLVPFTYFYDNGAITDQVMNQPNAFGSLSKSNTVVNGVNPAFDDFATSGQIGIVAACFGGLMKTGPSIGIIEKTTFDHIVLNNPVENELILRGSDLKPSNIICYDALGKSFNLSLTSFSETTCIFNVEGLATGMYFITVNNQNLKFIKL